MGSLGFDELLIVILVAIIVFGKDLPSVAKKVGTWYGKFKRHISDIKDDFQRQVPDIEEEVRSPDPPPGTTPSANLPGPEPGDPEYRGQDKPADAPAPPAEPTAPVVSEPRSGESNPPFDPAQPPANGNGADKPAEASSPAASESKPPDSLQSGGGEAAPPAPPP